MHKLYTVVFGFLILGLIASCTKPLVGYVTSTQNVPLLSDQYQGNVMAAIGFNHVEGQASFSPVKYGALMINGYSGNPGNSVEYGAGAYYPAKSGFIAEVYALRVFGEMKGTTTKEYSFLSQNVDAEVRQIDAQYDGFSAQINLGYKLVSDRLASFGVGLGIKYDYAKYDHFDYVNTYYLRWQSSNQFVYSKDVITISNATVHFLHVAPTLRVGYGPVSYFAQFAYHQNLDGHPASYDSFPMYSQIWFTNGFELRISDQSINKYRSKRQVEQLSR